MKLRYEIYALIVVGCLLVLPFIFKLLFPNSELKDLDVATIYTTLITVVLAAFGAYIAIQWTTIQKRFDERENKVKELEDKVSKDNKKVTALEKKVYEDDVIMNKKFFYLSCLSQAEICRLHAQGNERDTEYDNAFVWAMRGVEWLIGIPKDLPGARDYKSTKDLFSLALSYLNKIMSLDLAEEYKKEINRIIAKVEKDGMCPEIIEKIKEKWDALTGST